MKADFDTPVERRGTGSYKWDTPGNSDVLPMWVADMDFRTAPCIVDALRDRVGHGVFGYTKVGREYYDAVTGWFASRHGWHIDPDHIIYTSGVVPAISAILQALTLPGDMVITQTPAYNCFFSSIRNSGCQLAENPLRYEDGRYTIDFDDLERKAAEPRARILLLCNPHNPSGRVWTADELRRIGDICLRHRLTVIADEIHCEFTSPGFTYTPFASLSPELARITAACISPSKAFNIAGLQIANIVAADPGIRERIDRAININEVCDVNPFGPVATVAAYSPAGAQWLDELRSYLHDNYLAVTDYFARHLPHYRIAPLEGTYLVWIDITPSGLDADTLARRMLHEQRLMLSPGSIYGDGRFLRLNIACPRSRVDDALRRIGAVLNGL